MPASAPYIFPKTVYEEYPTAGAPIPNPSRPFNEGVRSNTLIQKWDGGNEQRRQKSAPVRTFDLNWEALLKDEYLTIRSFYISVTTCFSFQWMHPIEKTVMTVRFSNDVFQGVNKGHSMRGPIYSVQCKIEQVF